MAAEETRDIHIGETQRIHWVEFDTASKDVIDVDYIVAKHADFWRSLEINCVAGCCGLDAFRFYPGDIADASVHIDKEALKEDLVKLKLNLAKTNQEIVISSTLNQLVNKAVFVELLDHIVKYL
jgi:hypothetical protein